MRKVERKKGEKKIACEWCLMGIIIVYYIPISVRARVESFSEGGKKENKRTRDNTREIRTQGRK